MAAQLKVALTNLGKYNEGELVYEWVILPAESEEIFEAFEEIGVKDGTEYEEYFISDYETKINGLEIGEYDNIFKLNKLMKKIDELDNYEKEVFEAILENNGNDVEDSLLMLKHNDYVYYPEIYSYEELAEELVEQGYLDVPEHLLPYIDYQKIANDLKYSGEFSKANNGFIVI